jgi:hypothetical protein
LSGSAELSTAVHVHEGLTVKAGEVEVACTGTTIEALHPEITAPNAGSAESITLKQCHLLGPSGCSLSSETVHILPVVGEATLDGTLAIKEVIKSKTKTIFATIDIAGESCAISGPEPISGKSSFLAPTGQDPSILQLWLSSPTEGELKSWQRHCDTQNHHVSGYRQRQYLELLIAASSIVSNGGRRDPARESRSRGQAPSFTPDQKDRQTSCDDDHPPPYAPGCSHSPASRSVRSPQRRPPSWMVGGKALTGTAALPPRCTSMKD